MPNEMRDDCPPFGEILHPLLVLASKQKIHRKEVAKQLAKAFNLSEEVQNERTPKSQETRWSKNIGWATYFLSQAGLAELPGGGYVEATEAGKKFLGKHKNGFEFSDIKPLIPDTKTGSRKKTRDDAQEKKGKTSIAEFSPDDLFARAEAGINDRLEVEMLKKIKASPPDFLEKLVVKLLEAMKYGTGEQLGGSGDGGVDGVIYQDKLKLGKIYIQAKRYESQPVTPSLIREFIGTIVKRGADKGIFITTSSFTSAAKDEADDPRFNIVLIDGNRLAKLMVEHEIGCVVDRTIKIKKIDNAYFPPDNE